MIISKNWLSDHINLENISGEEICKNLNSIGLEVDSHTKFSVPEKIVVAKVEECVDHENSDHLHVCKVNIGKDENLQIVCGAKNVEAGKFVACALVGAVMPNGMKIKDAKLRGVESFGMLCSSAEIGLPKTNEGIMLLDDSIGELELGKELREYEIFNDEIIEIELTPNRGDCLSIRGVARDLGAKFSLPLKNHIVKEDDRNLLGIGNILSLHSEVNINSKFIYRVFKLTDDIVIDYKTLLRLAIIDSNKTHPIEKILEYSTHSNGVLFRAYDFDKIPKEGEKLVLDMKTIEGGASAVWAGNTKLSVAGISQVDDYKVSPESKIILIEANYTLPENINLSVAADKKQAKGEEVYRSSRGSEPDIDRAMDLLFDRLFHCAWSEPYSGAQRIFRDFENKNISFTKTGLLNLIGQEISKNEAINTLKALGFEISINADQEQIYAKAPNYRHDIANSQDICEEIVRMIGIENIAPKALTFTEKNRLSEYYSEYSKALNLRKKAASAGFYECVHYVFDNPDELKDLGLKTSDKNIVNPINNELSALRPSLINPILNSASRNFKNSFKSVKLFEFGKIFNEKSEELRRFGFLVSGDKGEASLLNGAKPQKVDFTYFANLMQNILGKFKLEKTNNFEFFSPYEQANIIQNGEIIGFIGRIHLEIEHKKDLEKSYYAEIYFDKYKIAKKLVNNYSKFQPVSRDLSLIIPQDMPYEKIKSCIDGLKIASLKAFRPVDIFEPKDLEGQKSLSLRFIFQDLEKTFQDEDIEEFISKILDTLKENLNIGIR